MNRSNELSKKTTKKRPKKTPRVRVTVEMSAPLGMRLTRANERYIKREVNGVLELFMHSIFIDVGEDLESIDLRVDRLKVGQDE